MPWNYTRRPISMIPPSHRGHEASASRGASATRNGVLSSIELPVHCIHRSQKPPRSVFRPWQPTRVYIHTSPGREPPQVRAAIVWLYGETDPPLTSRLMDALTRWSRVRTSYP